MYAARRSNKSVTGCIPSQRRFYGVVGVWRFKRRLPGNTTYYDPCCLIVLVLRSICESWSRWCGEIVRVCPEQSLPRWQKIIPDHR